MYRRIMMIEGNIRVTWSSQLIYHRMDIRLVVLVF